MSETEALESMVGGEYKYGFTTKVEYEEFPKGINEDIVREISRRKNEPEWVTEFRLEAFEKWKQMEEPGWSNVHYESPDFNEIQYYSATKKNNGKKPESLDDVDPEILATYEKLGIPLQEQKQMQGIAVDAIFDSESIFTTFKEKLMEAGVIFCSISEAIHDYPEIVKKYLGSVVPKGDNFYAALNSAVFSDGSFCYVPKDTVCPMELASYFRINNEQSGQFERTLIICEENSQVSYLEGCTAPNSPKPKCMPPWLNWWLLKTQKLNIPPFKTGIRVMKRVKAEFSILLPNADIAGVITPRFHGHKSKQVRLSPGNIPV
jgi:Fe-S cluster assembly protein SufB